MKKKIRNHRTYCYGNLGVDRAIGGLVKKAAGGDPASDLLREMIVTVLKTEQDGIGRGDLKMLNHALKELRYAFKVFAPYESVPKVAIFGSARTPRNAPDYKLTRAFAKIIAANGWMVITGASAGIMHAGNEGAGRKNSFGVNIRLPFEQDANPIIAEDPKLINFKYFFTRKLIFMRESQATVLCPGGFGTHDEGFETLTLVQTGKAEPRPIVCLDPPKSLYWKKFRAFCEGSLAKRGLIDKLDLRLIHFTHSAQDAANYVLRFYKTYHSSRYIRDLYVIRLKRPLSVQALAKLNQKFKILVQKGKIEQRPDAFDEESEEQSISHLPRVYFHFVRDHFATLHDLIIEINRLS